MRDLSNYALCARSRVQLGRRLTLNAVAEAPDAASLAARLRELHDRHRAAAAAAAAAAQAGGQAGGDGGASNGGASAAPASRPLPPVPELGPYTAHAALRCALPGHDLTATAGYNLAYVDSAGDASHVPLAVSLDLSSHDRADGLQYRVGLHQVGSGGLCRGALLKRCRASAGLAGWGAWPPARCSFAAHAAG